MSPVCLTLGCSHWAAVGARAHFLLAEVLVSCRCNHHCVHITTVAGVRLGPTCAVVACSRRSVLTSAYHWQLSAHTPCHGIESSLGVCRVVHSPAGRTDLGTIAEAISTSDSIPIPTGAAVRIALSIRQREPSIAIHTELAAVSNTELTCRRITTTACTGCCRSRSWCWSRCRGRRR